MESLIDFIKLIGKLKKLKRKGWIQSHIKDEIESVADHSFVLTILSLVIAPDIALDRDKLIKMSLIHDFPEIFAGDITPFEKTREEKYEIELQAMKKICSIIKNSDEYFDLWLEFEEGKSNEARFLKQLDKIEMLFQALEYETDNEPYKLDKFWRSTEQKISDPYLIKLLNALEKLRNS
ncbi:MAG: HD domain-containing protein [Candidatus Helarchaeota archaeon]